jgi:hypothetical protein
MVKTDAAQAVHASQKMQALCKQNAAAPAEIENPLKWK